MKKILFIIIVAVAIALPFSAYAGSTTMTENGEQNIDVFAKSSVDLPPNVYLADVIDNEAEFTTETGFTILIKIDGDPVGELRAFLIEVVESDSEAYKYLNDLLGTDDSLVFYVVFKDQDGKEVVLDRNFTVEITKPPQFGSPAVFEISADKTVNKLNFSIVNGKIVFDVSTLNYFAINNEKPDVSGDTTTTTETSETGGTVTETGDTPTETGDTPTESGSKPTESGDKTTESGDKPPKTGYESYMLIFLAVAVVSLPLLMIAVSRDKKKKETH